MMFAMRLIGCVLLAIFIATAAAWGQETAPATRPAVWSRPRFPERADERERMVRTQIAHPFDGRKAVKDQKVLDAMRAVPRHLFVPDDQLRSAYADRPLPIGSGQTISQPYIVAYMTQLLKLTPQMKVLEIGTGSLYQAAVLNELTPHVCTIEIRKSLANAAKKRIETLGYASIKAKQGDGFFGWEEEAPFDAIIVTAAAESIPPPLLKQLKPGGVMIIPVGGAWSTQYLVLVRKAQDGSITTRRVMAVRFVPFTRGKGER